MPLVGIREVAALLGISRRTAYYLAQHGKLPGVVRVGRAVRISLPALERWIGEGGTKE